MKIARQPAIRPLSGSVLVLSLLLLLALGALTATLAVLNLRLHGEHEQAKDDMRAFYVAEAGVNEAYAVLLANNVAGVRALPYPRETSSGSYQVELLDGRDDHAVDLDRIRLRSVGDAGKDAAGVQLMIHHIPTGLWRFAIFGADGVLLNSNVMTDSYDPADGPYPDKVEFVNDFGNVGSNKQIEMDANTQIYGDALVEEDGVFLDASNTVVTGDQTAGPLDEEMPPITVPPIPTMGLLSVITNQTIAPGNYNYTSVAVGAGTLTLQGPMTMVVDNLTMLSKAKLNVDTTNGPVKLYITGNVLLDGAKIRTNNDTAKDFEVMITSDNITGGKTLELHSNAEFMGTIYAPNARLRIPSNFRIYGAIKAKFVEMASNTRVHFDENLLYDPNVQDIFEIVSWRRLSQEEIRAVEVAPLP